MSDLHKEKFNTKGFKIAYAHLTLIKKYSLHFLFCQDIFQLLLCDLPTVKSFDM